MHFLSLLSFSNAAYTFLRKRHYRLFETSVDTIPSTPSAQRVRVDSSPVSSSPLQFLSKILGADNAQSRAHPDAQRDVWELAVWDPSPICLRLFCYFSPAHVILYWMLLPVLPSDPRPSVTIVITMLVALLLTWQLSILQGSFSQQTKDTALISKEVMHEYDTKFVHPRTQPLYRDVGTQYSEHASHNAVRDAKYNTVDTYRPMIVVNRGFKPNPNPNYSPHTDPDNLGPRPSPLRQTSANAAYVSGAQVLRTPAHLRDASSPLRPATAIRQPLFRPPASDGGSLGVYTHAASPLRKSQSTTFSSSTQLSSGDPLPKNRSSPEKRGSSPGKRMSVPAGGVNIAAASQRWGYLKQDRSRRESGRY